MSSARSHEWCSMQATGKCVGRVLYAPEVTHRQVGWRGKQWVGFDPGGATAARCREGLVVASLWWPC